MKKVFVGVSGGVDSSVSAYLLKKQGYDVTGVFIKVWQPDFLPCNWRNEMRDAMRVCAKLEIPFLFCDLSKEYKKEIVDYLISEYKNGRTPNPDVMCNKEIKFKHFLNFSIKKNADFIATGHYAQIKKKNDEYLLYKAVDNDKDQTYFLWNLNQKILPRVLFPVGHLKKAEVRRVAQKIGLNTAIKKDSQGLCFVGNINMKDFLKKLIKVKNGNILNEQGEKIGTHEGASLYTIGERHNLHIPQNTNQQKIYYVISKDLKNNTLTVSNKKTTEKSNLIKIEKYNLIRKNNLINKKIMAQIRYRQPLQEAKITQITPEIIEFEFKKQQESVTGGQSLVMHTDGECLGGGVII